MPDITDFPPADAHADLKSIVALSASASVMIGLIVWLADGSLPVIVAASAGSVVVTAAVLRYLAGVSSATR